MLDMAAIAEICSKARKRAGLLQHKIAACTGYEQSTISMFERGHINNARLLMWYVQNVLNEEEIKELLGVSDYDA